MVYSFRYTQGIPMWQADFKAYFRLKNGMQCHPLNILDDSSRFNRSFTRECLNGKEFKDIVYAQQCFDEYRQFNNEIRPHSALNLEVPASQYEVSSRKMPDKILSWEYGPEYQLCKVKDTGYFNYRGQGFFLSEAFAGKVIAVRESHLPGQITLVFRQFKIGRIDLDNRVYTLRKAYLLEGDPRANV